MSTWHSTAACCKDKPRQRERLQTQTWCSRRGVEGSPGPARPGLGLGMRGNPASPCLLTSGRQATKDLRGRGLLRCNRGDVLTVHILQTGGFAAESAQVVKFGSA